MLRRIVFLFCLVVVVSCPKRVPSQTTTPTAPASQEETDSIKGEDKTPVKDEAYWDKVRSAEVLPLWLTFGATLLAGGAALWGLGAIYNQAKYGRVAAEAALLNAQALINAERPWLMIQIDKEDKPRGDDDRAYAVFYLSVFNYGKTPAHVTRIRTVEYYFLDTDKNPALPLDYGKATDAQYFVGPNIKSNPFWTVDPNHEIAVMSRRIAAGRADSAPDHMKPVVWGPALNHGDGVYLLRHTRPLSATDGTSELILKIELAHVRAPKSTTTTHKNVECPGLKCASGEERHWTRRAYGTDEGKKYQPEQVVKSVASDRSGSREREDDAAGMQGCRGSWSRPTSVGARSTGGLQVDQAKRLKELEQENWKLKRLVANLSLDNLVLKDFASGNFSKP